MFSNGESELSNRGSIKIHKIKLLLRVFFCCIAASLMVVIVVAGSAFVGWKANCELCEVFKNSENCDFCVWDVPGDGWKTVELIFLI